MPIWAWRDEIPKGGEVIIFDLDGVISDASHRQHFIKQTNKDWKGFFSSCSQDPLILAGAKLINLIGEFWSVIILTARPESVQAKTIDWLEKHEITWNALIMRADQDPDLSSEMKYLALEEIRSAGLKPQLVFDDDPRNIEMFDREGISTILVFSGYYE